LGVGKVKTRETLRDRAEFEVFKKRECYRAETSKEPCELAYRVRIDSSGRIGKVSVGMEVSASHSLRRMGKD